MGKPSICVSMTLAILTLLNLNEETSAADYIGYSCFNTSTFTPNSNYSTNLHHLFSILSSNATREDGFYNTTVGKNTSNAVYGLFLCRSDISIRTCQECVDTAVQDVVKRCPEEKEALIWYDECMMRYSDQNFFSRMSTKPYAYAASSSNISDPDRFNQLLMATLNALKSQIASVGRNFATQTTNFTDSQILYAFEQCTPDISSADCSACIQEAIAFLKSHWSGIMWATVLFPSCRIKYKLYPIDTIFNAAAPTPPRSSGKLGEASVVIIATLVPATVVLSLLGFYLLRRWRTAAQDQMATDDVSTLEKLDESLQFDLATTMAATENFSDKKKIGAGGYGEVYKGTLLNGQEIAVKRLSNSSGQGVEAFKTELALIAKLQHRNLVRLLGFCLEEKEKILIYEFMPNKSLDFFLYDLEKKRQLDWTTRYKIIIGIVRGMLYLHEDSCLKIVHCDLKASNILLDKEMNPKIADFGISKTFKVDQTQGSTSRVAGTYGYMAPEYAIYGQFSVKSDVYSFGVLVLEIVTGMRNSSFYKTNDAEDLISYVWRHWIDGTPLELLDPTLGDSYSRDEVTRCIHIALLCLLENPADRPTMASIHLMLNKHSISLPPIQEPSSSSREWKSQK